MAVGKPRRGSRNPAGCPNDSGSCLRGAETIHAWGRSRPVRLAPASSWLLLAQPLPGPATPGSSPLQVPSYTELPALPQIQGRVHAASRESSATKRQSPVAVL